MFGFTQPLQPYLCCMSTYVNQKTNSSSGTLDRPNDMLVSFQAQQYFGLKVNNPLICYTLFAVNVIFSLIEKC